MVIKFILKSYLILSDFWVVDTWLKRIKILIKVITDNTSLKYFMITKKQIKYQVGLVKLLLEFNFLIFGTSNKRKENVDSLICCQNNPPLCKNYYCK